MTKIAHQKWPMVLVASTEGHDGMAKTIVAQASAARQKLLPEISERAYLLEIV